MQSPLKVISAKADSEEFCQEVHKHLVEFRANPAAFGPDSHGVVLQHLLVCPRCQALDKQIQQSKT